MPVTIFILQNIRGEGGGVGGGMRAPEGVCNPNKENLPLAEVR